MKIVGGQAKGRILVAPRSDRIRITTDKLKESLFDIVGPIEGFKFLDLFAGTGSVGIEALSREAGEVVFVEPSRIHVDAIKENLRRCGFTGTRNKIMQVSVEKAVPLLAKRNEPFDIVFADPPYEKGFVAGLLKILGENNLCEKDGLIVIERSFREECPQGEYFLLTDERRYGDTAVSFLKPLSSNFN